MHGNAKYSKSTNFSFFFKESKNPLLSINEKYFKAFMNLFLVFYDKNCKQNFYSKIIINFLYK